MRAWGACAVTWVLAACGPGLAPVDPTTSQTLELTYVRSAPIEIYVLAVDDQDAPDAAALRAKAADALRSALHRQVSGQSSCAPDDPARWFGGQVRVVIARPSAPDEEALLTWLDEPALGWTSHRFTATEAEDVAAAATAGLEARLASPGEVFEPLRAAKRALELVTGSRAPATAEETALVDSLASPDGVFVRVLVAGTREDEGLADVATLVPEAPDGLWTATVVAPTDQGDPASCGVYPPADTPLQQWAELTPGELYAWPCDVAFVWDGALASCAALCNTFPISVDPSGVASCKVEVDQWDLSACDPALGRSDPEGGPLLVTSGEEELRRCVVQQLAGPDLDACRHTLACSGCAPGFCATEVPELRQEPYCAPEGLHDFPIRFIGGAVEVGAHRVHVVCLAETPP